MKRDDASERQVQAAQPRRSTWLSANAGSGKTRVLTDRVARLLLSNVEPQRILCLTYTKAAASEMQNRLFRRLGEWAMLDDATLRGQLETMGAEGPFNLREARTLFARAIETPGGLKIQTIHSFCASVLRRFPLEAGVSPQFTEMEDRAATLLRADIVESLAEGPRRDVVAALAAQLTDESFDQITAEIARSAPHFAQPMPREALCALFDLPPEFGPDALTRLACPAEAPALLERLVAALSAGSSTDQKAADRLRGLDVTTPAALPLLEQVFLTGAKTKEPFSAKTGSFPTKATRAGLADIAGALDSWMQAVEQARPLRLALSAVERSRALHDFAAIFLPAYVQAKQQRGWLDFDDLILRTRDLLADPAVAAWVLYRLDGGIDHILVDEAQDTSPVQWEVVDRLAREFTAGEGAQPGRSRTIFVVGDRKQSIYSFQGADPAGFDRMRDEFRDRLAALSDPLQVLELAYSFRSAPAILSLVDTVFEGRAAAGFTSDEPHRAFHTVMPGRVDLWPVVAKVEVSDDRHWTDPVDQLGQNDHNVVLAGRIAGEIARMVRTGTPIPAGIDPDGNQRMRPVRPGDFLILVQRRSDLFQEVIRACKEIGLPIAGADRLKVGAELAVRDIAALLSFLATPEDDLSLAVALKSPLFGWDEQMLYDLAHKRTRTLLWPALRERAADFPREMEVLEDLRDNTDFLRPYDLIERILTRHDGRRRLLGRLGEEAEDGIDALLDQALAYERNAVPSLTGFLVWLETDELEIKRQMDAAEDRIRVMTVHGAKGLEAPVVILPDTGQRRLQNRDRLLPLGATKVWAGRGDDMPPPLRAARDALSDARAEERDRLLYVALTRAETWLIVAAAGELGSDGEAWHDRVGHAMATLGATGADFPTGQGLRLEGGDWSVAPSAAVARHDSAPPPLDPVFLRRADSAPSRGTTISPSDLGGAKALPGEQGLDEDQAKRRGRQVHRLLEFLPGTDRTDWPDTAARLLSQGEDRAEGLELGLLLDEARRVLTAPQLAPLFSGEALAEVALSAPLPQLDGQRVHGIVDRLILDGDRVLAVDFKTNAIVPDRPEDCPEGLLRQMGAYVHALAAIYPDKHIETAILWTRTATLMPMPHDLVTAALATTTLA
ncbi:double-strand break repair helicase AddA [Pseudooceanicola sp. 216_PA32_1]|uniref:DNA 3'-5' helicase n=1 Tax=Pseudooceanicola pacificus TaxID=2676438 RepID=A0A844WBY8_9RHOB|nr:double-strand break repair helicase AddA [Pseudooceanicola pacificus]MWB76920.1 double-strand break repair helicase AddA [Pseudooceanicola pacificus]